MFSYDPRFGLEDPAWLGAAIGGGIFASSLVLSYVFYKLLFPLLMRITLRTPTDLDSRIVRAIRMPMTLGIVVLGAYLSLTLPLTLEGGEQRAVNTVAGFFALLLGSSAVASIVSSLFAWYLQNVAPRRQGTIDERLVPLLRRITVVLVYAVGGLLALDMVIDVTPLVAGLGLGGLAVALAIQPTLANLFAGGYVMTEGIVSPGDYIELDGGVAGYVVDVGWRSVRIRTWGNNLVVVPNSKFAETIVTNYQRPYAPVNVYLICGISYDSDLYHVERVSREVMAALLETDPNGVKEYGSYFGYDNFGESNVNFWLFLQAKDRLASYDLRSALIQQLHRRFKEEGIVINYPVRTLQFPDGKEPEQVNRQLQPRQPPAGPDVPGGASADIDGPGPG